jgi:outer membrane protein OmpA-like peptidoglycan-associated protein
MRQVITAALAVSIAAAAGSACATKKFVTESVGEVDKKVESLGQSLEATQQRTKENAERITQVDQKADQVGTAAKAAQTSATAAQTSANAAGTKAAAIETSLKRLIFEVVINDSEGNFQLGRAELPDGVRAKLDDLATKLKAAPAGNYIEIEGHTDATGSPDANYQLGLARADAAKRYLYETYQIPLHKMNVISFGETKPVAPNNNRAGRAQNRRVVIRVLA